MLREERSAGRRAYFRNGRLHYNNRPPPRNRRTPTRRPDSPSAVNTERTTAQHVCPTYDTSTSPSSAQEDDRRPSSYNKRNNDHDSLLTSAPLNSALLSPESSRQAGPASHTSGNVREPEAAPHHLETDSHSRQHTETVTRQTETAPHHPDTGPRQSESVERQPTSRQLGSTSRHPEFVSRQLEAVLLTESAPQGSPRLSALSLRLSRQPQTPIVKPYPLPISPTPFRDCPLSARHGPSPA